MTAAEEVAVQVPSEADACVEEDVLAASGGLEGSGELEGSSLPADSDALAAGERDDADGSEIGGSDGALDAVRADGAADDGELAGRDAGKVSASSRFDVEALSDIANRVSQAASLVDAAQIARACKMADAAALAAFPNLAKGRAAGALAAKAASASAERVARTAVEGALKVAARRVVDAAATAAAAARTTDAIEAADVAQTGQMSCVVADGERFDEVASEEAGLPDVESDACGSCVETRGTSSEQED